MYHEGDPRHGSVAPGTLPNPHDAVRPYRSVVLTQKFQPKIQRGDERIRMLELRNEDVELPDGDDTLYWCKMFKLEDINRKHHLIRVRIYILKPYVGCGFSYTFIDFNFRILALK